MQKNKILNNLNSSIQHTGVTFLDRSTVWWSDLMGWAARAFLSSIHPSIHPSTCPSMLPLALSVCCLSAAISPTFRWNILTKLSGYVSSMAQLMLIAFLGQKNFKGHGPKRFKTVKIYLLQQFLSQDVHIFRVCCPSQDQKLQETDF